MLKKGSLFWCISVFVGWEFLCCVYFLPLRSRGWWIELWIEAQCPKQPNLGEYAGSFKFSTSDQRLINFHNNIFSTDCFLVFKPMGSNFTAEGSPIHRCSDIYIQTLVNNFVYPTCTQKLVYKEKYFPSWKFRFGKKGPFIIGNLEITVFPFFFAYQ